MGNGSAASVSAAETFTGFASSGRKGALIHFVTMIFVKTVLLMYKTPILPTTFLSLFFAPLFLF